MVVRWTKIFALGQKYVKDVFDGPVEVTEKIDGSQVNFGVGDDGVFEMLSKGATVLPEQQSVMTLFGPAYRHIESVKDRLPIGFSFHGEALCKPKHNHLTYEKTPKNNIALYGVTTNEGENISSHDELKAFADSLDIDVVPLLYYGNVHKPPLEFVQQFLSLESYLGKAKIEGIVIKNYAKPFMLGDVPFPMMQAKYVSEEFKENSKVSWKAKNKTPMEIVSQLVCTEARWNKAIQRLKEQGKLDESPKDIGPIIKELQKDIDEEDREDIKDMLWTAYKDDIHRAGIKGFPEWYKNKLVENAVNF